MHADRAAVVGSVQRQQARLQGDERRGRASADRRALARRRSRHRARSAHRAPGSGFGCHWPGRSSAREYSSIARVRPMPNSPSTMRPKSRSPLQSGTIAPPRSRHAARAAAASAGMRCAAVARADDDIEEPRGEVPGDDKRIATVVARSRQHQDARSTLGQHVAGDGGRRQSSALHQRLAGSPRLDGTNVRDAIDRLGTHRPIISTGGSAGDPEIGRELPATSGPRTVRRVIRQRLHQSIH